MATEQKLLTAEDLYCLPGLDGRYELIDGKVVEMAPAGGEHGGLMIEAGGRLRSFVRERGLGWVLGGDVGVILRRNPDRVRAPDLCFIAAERLPDGLPQGFLEIVPDLIVEIVSPADRAGEVRGKTEEWLQAGARLVWTLYPRTETVVASTPDGNEHNYRAADVLPGEPVLPGFSVIVAELFRV